MNRRYQITVDGKTHEVELIARTPQSISFSVNGETHCAVISSQIDVLTVSQPTHSLGVSATTPSVTPRTLEPGSVAAPMPGIVSKISLAVGDSVSRGSAVLVIEAMKMENNVAAPIDGKITEILVKAGEEVKKGQLLFSISAR